MKTFLPSRRLWILSLTLIAPQFAFAQHDLGQLDVTFTNAGLANPSVAARVYYPSSSAGSGVPLASGSWPVIAFGHGFNLGYLDYNEILHAVATAGYIVISPDVQNGFSVDHEEFARELGACIDFFMAENQSAGSLFFQGVASSSGVFGHSMGGGASTLVPSVYPEIDAVSGLASAETIPSAIAALGSYSGPYQVISGSADNVAPESAHQIPMYSAATGMKQWISILGGAHCKFTDSSTICDLFSSPGSVTRDFQIDITIKYVIPFFDFALKSDLAALPFICGDAIEADIAAGNLLNTTTINCPVVGSPFRRGDCSADGQYNIADAIYSLSALFPGPGGPPALSCEDACDCNDDGQLNVADPICILESLFVSQAPPPAAPHPACGTDPTETDALDCSAFAPCP